MKKTIIIGSLFAVCLMLIVPNISAVEYSAVEEKIQSNVFTKLENLENDIKDLTNNFKINLNLLFTILLKGIILPTLSLILSLVIAIYLWNIFPDYYMIISFVCGSGGGLIVYKLFLFPLMELIIEETGSFLLGSIIYFLLAFIDIRLAETISGLLVP